MKKRKEDLGVTPPIVKRLRFSDENLRGRRLLDLLTWGECAMDTLYIMCGCCWYIYRWMVYLTCVMVPFHGHWHSFVIICKSTALHVSWWFEFYHSNSYFLVRSKLYVNSLLRWKAALHCVCKLLMGGKFNFDVFPNMTSLFIAVFYGYQWVWCACLHWMSEPSSDSVLILSGHLFFPRGFPTEIQCSLTYSVLSDLMDEVF